MLNPGKYIIGDMCYLFDNDTWQSMCSNQMANLDREMISFEVEGVTCYMSCTAYGDGNYDYESCNHKILNHCKSFPVDAGLLGIISVDILDKNVCTLSMDELMSIEYLMVVEMEESFTPSYDDGTFDFNGIVVETDDRYDDDYDNYEDEDDDFE